MRIELTDGNWIEIKDRRSFADGMAIATASTVVVRGVDDDGEPTATVQTDYEARAVAVFERAVTDWSFPKNGTAWVRAFVSGDEFGEALGDEAHAKITAHYAGQVLTTAGK